MSHLRFGDDPIKSTYLINKADFVACHCAPYVNKYNMVQDLKDGGTFLLNCSWSPEEIGDHLPGQVKAYLAKHNIKFYTIDGIKIGKEIGLGNRINTVLQSAFFKLSGIIPEEDAIQYMKDAATKSYSKKGDHIVKMNHDAIDAGAKAIVEVPVPAEWADCEPEPLFEQVTGDRADLVDYVNGIQNYVNSQTGNTLPVSSLLPYADGHMPQGSAAYEKRGVAVDVPMWNPDNCIQCNFCSYVCPHACIRPIAMTDEELAAAPEGTKSLTLTGMPQYKFVMTTTVLDCTGCGSCVNVCPGNKNGKALTMAPLESQMPEQEIYNYGQTLDIKDDVVAKFKEASVKGSQFKQPLLEFSGACAGCGETPYAKLVTQLFGERMYVANATGCTSIWAGSSPATPYTVNKRGQGPAWCNSLFEDNAEFGLGMYLGQKTIRDQLKEKVIALGEKAENAEVKEAIAEFVNFREDCVFFRDLGLGLNTFAAIRDAYEKNTIRSRFISDYCTSYMIKDPVTKKNIEVTMMYDFAECLVNHFDSGAHNPLAGTINRFILNEAIKGTINFTPIITPSVNQKQAIDDIRVNYAIFQEDDCVVQTLYTSQDLNSQLSYVNNVLAIQEVVRAVRIACPRNRYSLVTGSDMTSYAKAVNNVLAGFSGNFDVLEFNYTQDPLKASQKIFYGILLSEELQILLRSVSLHSLSLVTHSCLCYRCLSLW